MQIDPHPRKVHTTAKPTPSWRDVLPIHPAAEIFPLMPPDELRALGEDIKKNGLREPVVLFAEEGGGGIYRETEQLLLDGRNRLDAMETVGLTTIKEGCLYLMDRFDGGYVVKYRLWKSAITGFDPYAFVISANIHRRHLSIEQKRDLIAKLIKATPEKSDRQIAETVKASPTTVGTVRAKMEAKGDVSKLDTRADSKGRQQPVKRKPKPTEADLEAWDAGEISRAEAERRGINTRPATKPVHTRRGAAAHVCWQCGRRGKVGEVQQRHYACYEDADVWLHDACVSAFDQDEQRREQQREAAAKRIHALMGGETEPHDDTGSANNGENARLRARNEELENENQRLQRENIALRSEIEELRAQLPPGNPGPVPASLRRAAP